MSPAGDFLDDQKGDGIACCGSLSECVKLARLGSPFPFWWFAARDPLDASQLASRAGMITSRALLSNDCQT